MKFTCCLCLVLVCGRPGYPSASTCCVVAQHRCQAQTVVRPESKAVGGSVVIKKHLARFFNRWRSYGTRTNECTQQPKYLPHRDKLLILLFCVFLTARYRSGFHSCCAYAYSPAAAPAPVFAGTRRSLHYQRRQIHHRGSQLHEAATLRPHSGWSFRSFV